MLLMPFSSGSLISHRDFSRQEGFRLSSSTSMRLSVRAGVGKHLKRRAASLLRSCAVVQVEHLQPRNEASVAGCFFKASVPAINWHFPVLSLSVAGPPQALPLSPRHAMPRQLGMALAPLRLRRLCGRLPPGRPGEMAPWHLQGQHLASLRVKTYIPKTGA